MEQIRYPCTRCNNVLFQNRDNDEADLFENGFLKEYVTWSLHGEEEFSDSEDGEGMIDDTDGDRNNFFDTQAMLEDIYAPSKINLSKEGTGDENSIPKFESKKFIKLLKDADKELYPGCKSFSKLSFVVTLTHIKIMNSWSNKSFFMLFDVLKNALSDGDSLPSSYYEAKTMIQRLGLDYEKIHACINDMRMMNSARIA